MVWDWPARDTCSRNVIYAFARTRRRKRPDLTCTQPEAAMHSCPACFVQRMHRLDANPKPSVLWPRQHECKTMSLATWAAPTQPQADKGCENAPEALLDLERHIYISIYIHIFNKYAPASPCTCCRPAGSPAWGRSSCRTPARGKSWCRRSSSLFQVIFGGMVMLMMVMGAAGLFSLVWCAG